MLEEMQQSKQITENVKCNCCGKMIEKIEKLNTHVDYLRVEKTWSYFSNKDLTKQCFNLCETCYDKLIETFIIPAEEVSVTEVFKCVEEIECIQYEEEKK